MAIQAIYRAQAAATGSGRDGRARTDDGAIDVALSVPKEMGGQGKAGATNPEQLFATGYAACYLGALRFVAGQEKVKVPDDADVRASVGIGRIPGGFGLEVALHVTLPGIDRAVAEDIVGKAHRVCPYSNATRGNIDVVTTIG